jgi:Arc/MetJ-type ribon-helix-helix transcriptional regulator
MFEPMPKTPSDTKKGNMPQIGVRIPPPALAKIDALVAERNRRAGWNEVTRSDVIRDLVMRGLDATDAEPKGGKKRG